MTEYDKLDHFPKICIAWKTLNFNWLRYLKCERNKAKKKSWINLVYDHISNKFCFIVLVKSCPTVLAHFHISALNQMSKSQCKVKLSKIELGVERGEQQNHKILYDMTYGEHWLKWQEYLNFFIETHYQVSFHL